MPPITESTPPASTPHLRRVLSLWDLILFGMICVTPSAPVTVFGVASERSEGHAVNTILLGMVTMVLTAVSYGRMAAIYPSAGSAYTYVGKGLHPYLGFLAGWAMTLDYVFCPLFCVTFGTLWGVSTLQDYMRAFHGYEFTALQLQIAFVIGTAAFTVLITYLNLRGIRTTARTNEVLMGMMTLVLLAFIVATIKYLFDREGLAGVFSTKPFYNPETFDASKIAKATSFAALTYLGFDSVTTLAEDARNARRNVLLAAVLVCVFTGVFGSLLVYLAQQVWPEFATFGEVGLPTAFKDVAMRAGGIWLALALGVLIIIANIGAGLGSQVGGARLLYGMGRDGVLPRRIFGYLSPKRDNPSVNIWLIGILAFVGSQVLDWEVTGELLNFGAFLGFIGVNLAMIRQFWFMDQGGRRRNFLYDVLLPLLGAVFCGLIWWNLNWKAMTVGGIWLAVGLVVLTVHTRAFTQEVAMVDMRDSE